MKQIILKLFRIVSSGTSYIIRPDAIAAVIVSVTVIAVTINTSGVILQNYRLERDLRVMEQKIRVAEIELDTQRSRNSYYATDYYLDIAARKLLSKGAPGENLIIVPKDVALRELPVPSEQSVADSDGQETSSNIQKWFTFLNGQLD